MTDRRILEACGWKHEEGAWYPWRRGDEEHRMTCPELTMQELWETLCRVCRKGGYDNPHMIGDIGVGFGRLGGSMTQFFGTEQYGSLTAAIEAAILWVLNQKEGGK